MRLLAVSDQLKRFGLVTLLLCLLTSTVAGQDSRPAPPKEKSDGSSSEKTAEKHKNPLDDPKMKQKAKLGKIFAKKRCVICHKIDGKGGVLSPPMEEVTAQRFKAMANYDKFVQRLKATDPARYNVSKKRIQAILDEENRYQKLMLWLKAYLDKPTFDNGQAKMVKQVMKPKEVENVIAWLLTLEPKE